MEIVVIGSALNLLECQQKLGTSHRYQTMLHRDQAERFFKEESIVFDFETENESLEIYREYPLVVFLDSSKIRLAELINEKQSQSVFFGFCGMPTFVNREILEVALHNADDQLKLKEVCDQLKTSFAVVKDQVGLVTPRVICMIINEAYFAVQENVASREAIDLAMKLGTNYPFGPFEWASLIGIKNVYELLDSVYRNTKDDRYKICELLTKEVLA